MNDTTHYVPAIATMVFFYSMAAIVFPRLYGRTASRRRAFGIGFASFIALAMTAPKVEPPNVVAEPDAAVTDGEAAAAAVDLPESEQRAPVPTAQPQAPSEEVKALRMSPRQIEDAVDNNEIAIRRRVEAAGGVIVKGRVTGVETTFWTVQISLAGRNPYLPVIAHMKRGNTDFAAALNKGQAVSLLCGDVKKFAGAALYDCTPHPEADKAGR